jgi:hypothetical protein
VPNVEDMGVGGIDTGSGEVWYIGDEHWDEGGEDDCEKTRCMSSRASPMNACSDRNVAKVGTGVMSESVKRLYHSDASASTNKTGSLRKRKAEPRAEIKKRVTGLRCRLATICKVCSTPNTSLGIQFSQPRRHEPVRRSPLGTYYCNKYSGVDPESSTMEMSSANRGS